VTAIYGYWDEELIDESVFMLGLSDGGSSPVLFKANYFASGGASEIGATNYYLTL
jgi:hypothetical protein